ncbi:ERAP1-like C-terminal domain-containing protein, partial [Leucobacter iarius]|uniref:ERAP1-like C-terminal domain-containing protein n=1 Tax=Leucobacter iarius TaxID=333963 RepID=UPI0031D18FCA
PTLRPHRIAVGLYDTVGEGAQAVVRRVRRIEIDIDGPLTEVPGLVGVAQPDLLLLNDDDLSYAKIRLDDRSLATVTEHLGGVEDSLARALLWGSVWDATRDAEFPASRFIDLVLAHVGAETNSTTLETLLDQLETAARDYVDVPRRGGVDALVAEGLWHLAATADPGSDHQLQFATAYSRSAVTPTQVDRVRGLLRDGAALDGLIVSDELGWELLTALVVAGEAGPEEIEARLAIDRTASGEVAALRARAARPGHVAKTEAWDSVFATDAASNHDVEAIAQGFLRVRDPALLEPFVEPFHDALLGTWESRSYSIAEQVIGGFYPAPIASLGLSAATRNWLDAHPEAAPTLRRLVGEPLADLERALAAQERDRREVGPPGPGESGVRRSSHA